MHSRAPTPAGPGTRSRSPASRRGLPFAAAAAICILGGCGSDKPTTKARPLDRPQLQQLLADLTRDQRSAAVALAQTTTGVWHGASDAGRPTRTPAPKRFGIASTTKTFVATVVLQLAAERHLSLDDPVERWLPGLVPNGRKITIRQLLNHTSGLSNDVSGRPPRERVRMAARQGLYAQPGTTFAYSNTNYVVLGLIVEEVTGHRVDRAVQERILRPLHLDRTSYGPFGASLGDRSAAWLGTPEPLVPRVSGDSGIVSTTDDLATFFRALFTGELLPRDLLSELRRTVAASSGLRAGLGVFRLDTRCGAAWGHGGVEPAYSTMALAARDGSRVVVVAETGFDYDTVQAAAEEMYCASF
jgi:D-alanyl-D-alanine carboxypeptidase